MGKGQTQVRSQVALLADERVAHYGDKPVATV
jgi:hypothetical protein